MHGCGHSRATLLTPQDIEHQVAAALREDIGSGDVTAALVPVSRQASGGIVTREAAILCGCAWVTETFRQLDPSIELDWHAGDGDLLLPAQSIVRLKGPARPLLTGERTALNFLQLLSATATDTKRYVDAVSGTGCIILDTRKTIPGLRLAQKYAVTCGGGANHRLGLYDMVLIKENHVATAGSITAAIAQARAAHPQIRIEVEVETLAEFEEARAALPNIIMLDEFSLEDMRTAVARNRSAAQPSKLEASGNVNLQKVRQVAETGVDFISVGAITKHVRAIDLSMRIAFS